jgi:hypothetical protein
VGKRHIEKVLKNSLNIQPETAPRLQGKYSMSTGKVQDSRSDNERVANQYWSRGKKCSTISEVVGTLASSVWFWENSSSGK